MAIERITGNALTPPWTAGAGAAGGARPTGPSFAQTLSDALHKVETAQSERDDSVQQMVTGEIDEVHDVMVAAEEANLAFDLMLEVRNRLLESYNHIMQMQV